MTHPSKEEVSVATESLRSEANVWEEQAAQIGAISPKAESLRLTRLEAGIFQLIVSEYEQVVNLTISRCQEGEQRMGELATALRNVANVYEEEERNNEHEIRNTY
ncbi:hypothetical protein WEI85_43175 [Actinomycetes bacterium KLBMP 9797]